jgi:hypothetical protein
MGLSTNIDYVLCVGICHLIMCFFPFTIMDINHMNNLMFLLFKLC